MDPAALAACIGGGLIVAAFGLAWGLAAWGRGTRSAELDMLEEIIGDLRATLDAERKRERIRSAGAALDYQRAVSLAAASAAGDLDGVLSQFPDDGDATDADEPSNPAQPGGSGDAHG